MLAAAASDCDAGRRADVSEHVGVERSRGDRRSGSAHRAARAGGARTRARRERADDYRDRPQSGDAASKLEGLTAVVSLLDRNGALVSTKDVPLDYRALGPGEEAPFKVSIPDPGSIARYRVSFRAGTDVVPHVDRRTDTKLASALQ